MPEANAPALAALARRVALAGRRWRQGARAHRGARRSATRPTRGRARGARRGLRRRDAAGRRALPRRRLDPHALCRGGDGHPALGLLGGGRREAEGPRRRDRRALETVLKRNPTHPGAIHLYIHAVEASTTPETRAAARRRLAALMPGAGHIVHMPAHIYYRVGPVPASRSRPTKAIAVDEHYFAGLALRPDVPVRLLPAQHPLRDGDGADGRRRHDRDRGGGEARRGDARRAGQAVRDHAAGQGRALHDQRSSRTPIPCWPCQRPTPARCSCRRCITMRGRWPSPHEGPAAPSQIDALAASRRRPTSSRSSRGTCRPSNRADGKLVATGRLADAMGDLERAAGPTRRRSRSGRARLHGAAVLVLPGAPIARRRAPAPGSPR